MLTRNLESVFCLSIPKSQGEARNLDSGWRYLDLEICPVSKIRGEARNLDSGWPEPVLGNCPVIQNPWRVAESGIWMARAAFLETRVDSRNPGSPPPPALSLTVQCVRLPPVLLNRYRSILLFFFASCGNSESWKVETAITLPVVCTFPAREMPLQRCKAIAPGVRNGLARARVQRAPRAARHRVGARSHPRRTG